MEQELNLPASPAAVSETGAVEELNASGDEVVEIVGVRFREGGKVYYFAP